MPCTRRINARLQSSYNKPTRIDPVSNGNQQDGKNIMAPPVVVQPRHAHLPDIPVEGNLYFQLLFLIYGTLVMGLQYVNLYRTVWWLPMSHATYGLNFYLMDIHFVGLLILILGRGFIWTFVKEVQGAKSKRSFCYWFTQLMKLLLVLGTGAAFINLTYNIALKHPLMSIMFLCYPLGLNLILFWQQIRSTFQEEPQPPVTTATNSPTHVKNIKYNKNALMHVCSMSPDVIREEVEIFKTDFNRRIKQILFYSVYCTYYSSFMPLCFAQNTLYYDPWWVTQHILVVWISSFIFCAIHFLPPSYVDTLHKSALHLGRWQKVEGRHAHVPYNAWSELQVWQQGVLVKHVKGLFKAEGINNAAEPGNGMHTRFNFFFSDPLRLVTIQLLLCWSLVIYLIFTLLQSSEWHHVLGVALLLCGDYYILYRLMRDWLLLRKTYREEMINHPHAT